jgi:hypothetical protein
VCTDASDGTRIPCAELEAGKKQVSIVVLKRIARALQLSLDDIAA